MAEATLRIALAGVEELRRVLGGVREVNRATVQGIAADARAAATTRRRDEATEVAQTRRDIAALARARQQAAQAANRAEQERTRAALREAATRKKAEERASRDVARGFREATRIVESENRKRERSEEQTARRVQQLARAKLAAQESLERQHTALHARELERRYADSERTAARERQLAARTAAATAAASSRAATRTLRQNGQANGRMLGAAGGAALSFGSQMYGQIADARERRAMSQRTLGSAMYQVGADAPDVQAAMRQVTQFAGAHGMDSGEINAAIAGAQGQFSNLEGGASYRSRVGGALDTALLARNTGNDVGQFLRLQGMLNQARMDPAQQRQMLLFAAGAAQHGAVELGDLTSQALPAIMGRMSTAVAGLGAGATPAARQEAQRAAFVQSVSELEVARGFGNNPGQAGNALRGLTQSLQGSTVQSKMLTNIRSSHELSADQRRQLEASLFEADPSRQGHQRLRTTNALEVAERFSSIAGDNPALLNNVFAGGGHGNPMALQRNWRSIMGVMTSADADGVTGAQRMRRLMDTSTTSLSEADVARGSRVFGSDPLAQMTGARERADNAMTDNTSAIVTLTTRIQDLITAHPVGAAAAGAGAGLAQAVIASRVGAAVAGGGGALGTGLTAARTGGAWGAVALAGASLGVGLGEGITRGTDRLAGGGAMRDHRDYLTSLLGEGDNHELSRAWHSLTGSDVRQASAPAAARPTQIDPASAALIGQKVAEAMNKAPLQISAQVLAHAQSVAATHGGGRRGR